MGVSLAGTVITFLQWPPSYYLHHIDSGLKGHCWNHNLLSSADMVVWFADNVYGVMPQDVWLHISVWLMIIHQMLVFAFVMLPVFFMAEKACRVHTRSIWLRYLVRIPIGASCHTPPQHMQSSHQRVVPTCCQ
jgi:hypothetical protein